MRITATALKPRAMSAGGLSPCGACAKNRAAAQLLIQKPFAGLLVGREWEKASGAASSKREPAAKDKTYFVRGPVALLGDLVQPDRAPQARRHF
jgi:hypothetical protein